MIKFTYTSPQTYRSLSLPTEGDEEDISRQVSSFGTPEAVWEDSGQVQRYEKISQNGEDDDWDVATVDGDELDAVIEEVMKVGEQPCDLCDVLVIRINLSA